MIKDSSTSGLDNESGTPPEGFVAALAGFQRMTVPRLRALLRGGSAAEAYAMVSGSMPPTPAVASMFARSAGLAACWRTESVRHEPAACWNRCVEAGVSVLTPAHPAFPDQLLNDAACPAALFVAGDLRALEARRVGIVGTRNATRRGRQTAAQFGYELAEEGVAVVSGLARGVDGAAHRGALAVDGSRPIGVVGNGLDLPYPTEHTGLWGAVAERGVLISEWPPGTPPAPFRFPLRNRILAALVEVLVVVESRERGGSLITVREALYRNVDVMAVPGSLHTRAAKGTNQLISDGAAPALDTSDILMALSIDHRRSSGARFDPRPRPRGDAEVIVKACRETPRTLDSVVLLTGLDLSEAALAMARLEHEGWLSESAGWFEVVDSWADLA